MRRILALTATIGAAAAIAASCSEPAAPPSRIAATASPVRVLANAQSACSSWVECAEADPAASNYWTQVWATFKVPKAPFTPLTGSQAYLAFAALQSLTNTLQATLQYGVFAGHGGQYWSIWAMDCNSSGNCVSSSGLTVNSGDVLEASVVTDNSRCNPLTCQYTVTVWDSTTGHGVQTLFTEAKGQFVQGIAGAVRELNFTSCNQYPRDGVKFTGISLYDASSIKVTPNWTTFSSTTITPQCSFSATTTTTTASLGPYPYPPFSISISGPITVQATGGSCNWVGHPLGGIPPYTYAWTWDGGQPKSTQGVTYDDEGPAGQRDILSLTVTDSTSNHLSLSPTITIVAPPNGSICLQ